MSRMLTPEEYSHKTLVRRLATQKEKDDYKRYKELCEKDNKTLFVDTPLCNINFTADGEELWVEAIVDKLYLEESNFIADIGCVICKKEYRVYYNLLNIDFAKEIRNHFLSHLIEYLKDNLDKYYFDFFSSFNSAELGEYVRKTLTFPLTINYNNKDYLLYEGTFFEDCFQIVKLENIMNHIRRKNMAKVLLQIGESNYENKM